ncbi:MAG: YkuS family protein [Limnochordaceae bacterium]|nr:YkuS family protein [Limnochordaceae bacterium]
MNQRRVALDDKLEYLRRSLQQNGYQVVGLTDGLRTADAVVISGMNRNLTGAQDIRVDAPVVDADGKTPDEVLAALAERLS